VLKLVLCSCCARPKALIGPAAKAVVVAVASELCRSHLRTSCSYLRAKVAQSVSTLVAIRKQKVERVFSAKEMPFSAKDYGNQRNPTQTQIRSEVKVYFM
jgi:hypothetical protein